MRSLGLDIGTTFLSIASSDGVHRRIAHPAPLFQKGRLLDPERMKEILRAWRADRVVVSVPVPTWLQDRTSFGSVEMVPSPAAASAGSEDGIYIDIGAATVDLCRRRRGRWAEGDLICLWTAGDAMDELLFRAWKTPTIGAARERKEQGEVDPHAIHLIVKSLSEAVDKLTSALDPVESAALRRNVVLSGGGCLVRGLDRSLGARRMDHPETAAAAGALKLASAP